MEYTMYQPTVLGNAAENLKQMREDRIKRKSEEAAAGLGECAKIFEKIGEKPIEEMEGIAYCLSADEKNLLVPYIFSQMRAAHECKADPAVVEDHVNKYVRILTNSQDKMPDDVVMEIYKGCQENFKSQALKPLYETLEKDDAFCNSLRRQCGQDAKELMRQFAAGTIAEHFNKLATAKTGQNGNYAAALEMVGVIKDTALYNECMVYFIVICNAEEYRRFKEEELYEMAKDFDEPMMKKLLINMVKNLDTVQLRKYSSLVELFEPITGAKGSDKYNKIMEELAPQYQSRYAVWLNQFLITKMLGKSTVADFWLSYASKISVSVHPCGSLLLDFGKFTVIEVVDENTAYFYEMNYFKENVAPNIIDFETESELNQYLAGNTDLAGNNWRRVHMGDWQYSVRDYISRYSQ
jgi:hypothetical protein